MTVQQTARTASQGYVFDPTWDLETERLRTNETIWDPGSFERLDRIGVGPGWSCLEIGAGAGSTARWLAERVSKENGVSPGIARAAAGRVVATDLETRRLGDLDSCGVEVWQHDIRASELPDGGFDLVHARMLVQHLADKRAAVDRMIRALRPGGVLFLEDTDSLPLFRSAASEDFLQDVRAAGYGLMRRAGHEPRGGHFDLQIMLDAGLADVSADGRVVMVQGGSSQARHYMLWLEYMRPKILSEGLLDDARIDAALSEMADPGNRWLSQVMISVIGRKQ
jgi:SAM-dependent methyltransferase